MLLGKQGLRGHFSRRESIMRMLVALVLMVAFAAPVAARAAKNDIRGLTIGMTPEQERAAFADCKHQDPANIWQSAQDSAGTWIGRSVMTCRVPGEPDSALRVTFTSALSGKVACRIEYQFYSPRTTDALVADVMAQFGVAQPREQAAVRIWHLSSEVTLELTAYTQHKTLGLRNDSLCERDQQAVAHAMEGQQNAAAAPTF
jgi:hypothetical protein